jgi:hypothetical protein
MKLTISSFQFPLSNKQKKIWSKIASGMPVNKLAEELNTTRQYVNQTYLVAEGKLSNVLMEFAKASDLYVISIYPRHAILLAYHPILRRKAIITYSTIHGVKLWFWHEELDENVNPELLQQTKQFLLDLAIEHGLTVTDMKIHPAKLAQEVFCRLAPEVKEWINSKE